MALQLDKSLYTKINRETQAAVDAVNQEAERLMSEDHEAYALWGCQTTLRKKRDFLEAYKNGLKSGRP
jgi:hypothetical protein